MRSGPLACVAGLAHTKHRSTAFKIAVAITTIAASGCTSSQSQPRSAATTAPTVRDVTIQGFAFAPAQLEITRGETARWTNRDVVAHTATGSGFDSGAIETGQSWTHTFAEPGRFPYICTYHPEMTGTVVVK